MGLPVPNTSYGRMDMWNESRRFGKCFGMSNLQINMNSSNKEHLRLVFFFRGQLISAALRAAETEISERRQACYCRRCLPTAFLFIFTRFCDSLMFTFVFWLFCCFVGSWKLHNGNYVILWASCVFALSTNNSRLSPTKHIFSTTNRKETENVWPKWTKKQNILVSADLVKREIPVTWRGMKFIIM